MNPDQFWRIVEKANREAEGDGEGTGEAVEEILGECSAEQIREFATHLNDCLARSYTASIVEAYAIMTNSPDGTVSDDGFEYFRAWLISRGRRVFEAALANSDSLAQIEISDVLEECSSESLLAAVDAAYEAVTGEEGIGLVDLDISRSHLAGPPSSEPRNPLPKLTAKYRQRSC